MSWPQDKDFRDTGLYVGGIFDKGKFTGGNTYGTHKAVKVYYSPDVAEWLRGGRKGELKDGATIIKEMYDEPANQNKKEDNSNLAIMIKDKNGAWDGWFWSDGSGSATVLYEIPLKTRSTQPISVTATLYYQSIPPYYLKQRFTGLREPATLSLQYYVQNLNTNYIDPQWTNMLGVAPIRDWKLKITSVSKNMR
ncbi:MAG TPA: hypothetical protein VM911_03770 [Pyrinomonadaceae bacterium]|nr:hypothetical protein [Pyrinomonadaceae bacterium]